VDVAAVPACDQDRGRGTLLPPGCRLLRSRFSVVRYESVEGTRSGRRLTALRSGIRRWAGRGGEGDVVAEPGIHVVADVDQEAGTLERGL